MENCDGGRIIEETPAFCYLGDLREAFESPSVPQFHCARIDCMCKFERKEWVNICCINSRHTVTGFGFYFPFLTEDFPFGSSVKEWRNKWECTVTFSTVPQWVKVTFQEKAQFARLLLYFDSFVFVLNWLHEKGLQSGEVRSICVCSVIRIFLVNCNYRPFPIM